MTADGDPTANVTYEDYQMRLANQLQAVCIETAVEVLAEYQGDNEAERRAWAEEELQKADALARRSVRLRSQQTGDYALAAWQVTKRLATRALGQLDVASVAKFLAVLPYSGLSMEDQLAMADACRAAWHVDSVNGAYLETRAGRFVVSAVLHDRKLELKAQAQDAGDQAPNT